MYGSERVAVVACVAGFGALAAAGGSAWAGSAAENAATIRIDAQPEQADMVRKALVVFLEACPPLSSHWGDVATAVAEFVKYERDRHEYRREKYGWNAHIYVKIELKEKTGLPPEWRANGTTVHYYLGGGRRPGVLSGKSYGRALCGLPREPSGEEGFTPAPALKLMDAGPMRDGKTKP